MKKLRGLKSRLTVGMAATMFAAVLLFGGATAGAQTYSVLYNLGTQSGDPVNPAWVGLFAQGRDGNLYSTTQGGGANALGTVFQLTPSGSVKVLHSFSNTGTDGIFPYSGLTLGTDGSLYGTTYEGGSQGFGSVFKITTAGTFTLLHSFNGVSEGELPVAPPIQGTDGNYYGTTSNGGGEVFGTVYKMTPSGTLTTIYTFDGTIRYPYALTLGTDGSFYGTFGGGSTTPDGAVFKITPQGKLTILHIFNITDGQSPYGEIIQGKDGNFYGVTEKGGVGGFGVVYKMTPTGVLTDLHSFNEDDGLGLSPVAGLLQATDGTFYGVAGTNFSPRAGVLFQITSTGTYTVLFNFTNTVGAFPGASPVVPLFQHTSGTFYGDTDGGGTGNMGCITCGVLFSYNVGLGPFVSLLPYSGKVGKPVEFLGQGFTGTTSVSFNRTAATFRVVSDTYLTATVPSGAKTGAVTVVTPSATLTSNKTFRVTPQITSFAPPSGPVGTPVTITGVSLAQTTKVTFGGVKATTFTINSDMVVTATVPTGARTGKIAITTQGGTATSATSFTVTP
jgi:uncharacterized repeat protein (TIGR03803 family)